MANKKYVSLSKLQTFLDNLRNTFASLTHSHTTADITDYIVDTELSATSTNPVQNKVLDAEFDAISKAMGALETSIDGKADSSHFHDDIYYTETEIDAKLLTKSDASHNHDSTYYGKTDGETLANTLEDVKEDIADLQATDGKVKQVLATANSNYRLLLTPSFQTETTTAQTYFDSDVYLNPYYNKIYGVDIDGNADSASKLTTDAGSVNQPVYFADGVPVVATGVYSKADHEWTLIYDSGELSEIANSIAGINVSGYTNFEVLIRCYNDGDSHTTRTGSAIFTAQNGKSYQFPVWTNMFSKSISTVHAMAQFKLVDGWLVCPCASSVTSISVDIFDSPEGGTAGNLVPTGSGMMKCTSPLSTLTISNLDQNSDYYFGTGSRVMVWGWKA